MRWNFAATALSALSAWWVSSCGDNKHVDAHYEITAPLCQSSGTNIVLRQLAITQGSAIMVAAPDGDARQFVVEQEGRIRILDGGNYQPAAEAFLDISADNNGPVACCFELGFLGLAFHPQYATNGFFYVSYTAHGPNGSADPFLDIVMRYTTKADDPSHADPSSGQLVLAIPDPYGNHNGGMIEFGSDGFLYWGTGDGGSEYDPNRTGQDPNALLGKILRIDVDHPSGGRPYGIPADNPFAGGGGAPEVFILGTRNPWRWSFDRANGDMWIGDVGQDTVEELDYLPAGKQLGVNLGWSMYEGSNCFRAPCTPTGQTFPAFTRLHSQSWCSVIGGQVYRGSCFPDLVGTYFFSDYCDHPLEEATANADGTVSATELLPTAVTQINLDGSTAQGMPPDPSGFHADGVGELWLTTTTCCGGVLNGAVYHVEATP